MFGRNYDEILKYINESISGGGKHSNQVAELRAANHIGCDISEDKTMIIAYFENRKAIMLAPYSIVKVFNY